MTTFTTEDRLAMQSMNEPKVTERSSAYELAKYWDNEAIVMSKTTAMMLRQQADQLVRADSRIAELEKEVIDLLEELKASYDGQ